MSIATSEEYVSDIRSGVECDLQQQLIALRASKTINLLQYDNTGMNARALNYTAMFTLILSPAVFATGLAMLPAARGIPTTGVK